MFLTICPAGWLHPSSLPDRTGRNPRMDSLVRNISHKCRLCWGWGGICVIDSQRFFTATDLIAFDCLWRLLLPLWLRWKLPLHKVSSDFLLFLCVCTPRLDKCRSWLMHFSFLQLLKPISQFLGLFFFTLHTVLFQLGTIVNFTF